ncbi:uncharacterized protein LAESUDRAFT_652408 [Laetiporus sulphureus 93-53]|uniref:Uncharacterized protein n=1 Tax=Laetiporus sulphureus 93-53 TaxID=1314785 RepID=A0A165EFD2_9APHY|nr:uncharacterized protein LAESUDRAFT_652408 [Laetiporus sulphureus 93-53]KZT06937.1 hypothetical protein LAESUDRAFT_652408 [Laetiporus sulphureus 93-53]
MTSKKAAKFVLHGMSPSSAVVSSSMSQSTSGTTIKTEDISLLIKSLVKSMQVLTAVTIRVLPSAKNDQTQNDQTSSAPKPASSGSSNSSTEYCHYCSEAGEMIGTCEHVEEDIKADKCM